MYGDVTTRDPDSFSNAIDHAANLIYAGRIEADPHRPELARHSLERAQGILERAAERSQRHGAILNALDESRTAIKALPLDSAIVPH
jgi:hypothetical protein